VGDAGVCVGVWAGADDVGAVAVGAALPILPSVSGGSEGASVVAAPKPNGARVPAPPGGLVGDGAVVG
jgi:hypothetical protein